MNTNMVLYQQLFLGTIHILRKQDLGLFLTVSLHEHDSYTDSKVENILKGSLDSIPSPSPSLKIQIMGGKVCIITTSKLSRP